jgi:hypothetical protein
MIDTRRIKPSHFAAVSDGPREDLESGLIKTLVHRVLTHKPSGMPFATPRNVDSRPAGQDYWRYPSVANSRGDGSSPLTSSIHVLGSLVSQRLANRSIGNPAGGTRDSSKHHPTSREELYQHQQSRDLQCFES